MDGNILKNPKFILGVYILVTIIASSFLWLGGPKVFNGIHSTHYNNYLLFKHSFSHLIGNKDLYIAYPQEHWDLYKYSPTFALGMFGFAHLPDWLGLVCWNLLNALMVFFAIKALPFEREQVKIFILWFVLLELLTSLQNAQSNGLVAGLILFSFALLEKKNCFIASLCIALCVYTKPFGLVACTLFLLYDRKIHSILYFTVWMALLATAPLIFVSPEQLLVQYQSWFHLLSADHSASMGLSVMGWMHSWFHSEISKSTIVLGGAILFCLPFIRTTLYKDLAFRILFLSSILLWIVIFNHKAESPTFVIAMCGVALWYFTQLRRVENLLLVCFAFIFTSLSPTDLFPGCIRKSLVVPYVLKAAPCILIWVKVLFEMVFGTYSSNLTVSANHHAR